MSVCWSVGRSVMISKTIQELVDRYNVLFNNTKIINGIIVAREMGEGIAEGGVLLKLLNTKILFHLDYRN